MVEIYLKIENYQR